MLPEAASLLAKMEVGWSTSSTPHTLGFATYPCSEFQRAWSADTLGRPWKMGRQWTPFC